MRFARLSDYPFVRELAAQAVVFLIPETRDVPAARVQALRREALRDLEEEHANPDRKVLVALEGERPVGYLILQLDHIEPTTGERQTLIEDLAVLPEHYGRYVVHRLVTRAAQVTARKGLRYMIGEVSAGNERTLRQALRLGFVKERYQIVMQCQEQGAGPRPERPAAWRAHDVQRAARRRKTAE